MEYKTKLFVFSRIYNNTVSLDDHEFSNHTNTNVSDIEIEWHKYWTKYGDKIVNSSWLYLYSDYINPEYEQLNDNIENLNLKEVNILEKIDGGGGDNKNNITESDWQDLWNEHYQYEYCKCFNLFSENFYNAEKVFDLNNISEERTLSSESEDRFSTINDSDELKALGLPTAFASNTRFYKYRKRNSSPLFDEYFSTDSETDNEDNNMDEHLIESETQNEYENLKEPQNDEFQNESPNILASNLTKLEGIQNTKRIRKRKTKKRSLRKIPQYIREDKTLIKFWRKRFQLFSRFNLGIKMDKESWFSVTPEKIAKNIANRMSHCDIVIDGFCGSGGNCIQLAMICKHVIAIDIDPIKIEMAKHNAKIYNVDKNIEFIIGDFFKLCDTLKADGIVLSPPWGGPKYKEHLVYDIEKFLLPLPATELMERCRNITENIALYIPRNSDKNQIIKLAGIGKQTEIEQNYVDNRLNALTCYYGDLIQKKN